MTEHPDTDEDGAGFLPAPEGQPADAIVTRPIGEEDLMHSLADADEIAPTPEDAYDVARKEAAAAEKTFADLSTVQHIRELWEAKGIHPNDPLFAFIEMMGLWDLRQRSALVQLAGLIEKSDIFNMAVLNEMRELVSRMEAGRGDIEKMAVLTGAVCKGMSALEDSSRKMLTDLPGLYSSTTQAVQVIGEMGKYQVLLNMAVPVVCILVGMLAMFGLLAFLGMITVG